MGLEEMSVIILTNVLECYIMELIYEKLLQLQG